jgi:hypothetical protein
VGYIKKNVTNDYFIYVWVSTTLDNYNPDVPYNM